MEKKKDILLIGSYYFTNLGDPLFILTAKMMIEKKCDNHVVIGDLFGRKETIRNVVSISHVNHPCLIKKVYNRLIFMLRKVGYLKLYLSMTKNKSFVLIPGGGFISFSRTNPYHERIRALELACRIRGIKLCMNSVGICRDVDKLFYWKKWKRILRSSTIGYLSCRDGKQLIEKCCGFKINQVGCSATLAGELFGIEKSKDSNIIGIGVIRGNAFSEYGYSFNENQLINFYCELIRAVRKLGYEAKLFINGLESDYEVAKKIEEEMKEDGLLLPTPDTPEELVKQVSVFKAVCCARMHAAITAFSLDIPTVLLCWGVKGIDFMKMVGAEKWSVSSDELNVDSVVKKIQDAIETGWTQEIRKKVQKSSIESIEKMLSQYK